MRIEALIPFVENGMLMFPGHDRSSVPEWCEPLVQEMEQFPVGKYVDCLDSLAYQLQLIIRPGAKRPPPPREDTMEAMRKRLKKFHHPVSKSGIPILGQDRVRIPTPVTIEVAR
jgi:hypothetical protein